MMAMNDIAMADEGLGEWTATADRRKVFRQNGGRLYYGRMLMAHVYEALSIIKDIQKDTKLRAAVQKCDAKTRGGNHGAKCESYLPTPCRPPSRSQKLAAALAFK